MRLSSRLAAAALLVTVLAVPAFASAQQDPGDGADLSPGELTRLFDTMLVMQAQNALALTEPQFAQFLPRLRDLQETRRRNLLERARLIGELQRLTNPRSPANPSEAEIRQRLETLREVESRAAAEVRKAYSALDEILTPLQQARFRVLEEQIERRKLELVGRARQNQARPNNQRQPPRRPPGSYNR